MLYIDHMNDAQEKKQTIYFPVKINIDELLCIEKITNGEDIGEIIKKSISLYGAAKKITDSSTQKENSESPNLQTKKLHNN